MTISLILINTNGVQVCGQMLVSVMLKQAQVQKVV